MATQSGSAVTLTNAAWNGSIPAGGSQQIGFNGSHTGTNTAPTSFTLNGTTCIDRADASRPGTRTGTRAGRVPPADTLTR